jgi:LysM domain-containing protein
MASGTYDGKKGSRGSRFAARILALIALAGVAVVVIAVVSNSLDSNSSATATHQAAPPPHKVKPKDDCFVVPAGFFSGFSGIANHEGGVTVQQLEHRNQGVDSNNLQAGQRINVVGGGC